MKALKLDAIDRLILAGLISGTLGFLFTWWPLAFLFVALVCFALAIVEGRAMAGRPQQ